MYVEAILVVVASLFDRLRGGWKIVPTTGHKVAGALYGVVLGYLLGLPPALCGLAGLLWWLGEKPGWGYPMGWAVNGVKPFPYIDQFGHPHHPKPERWQVGFLENQPWLSLIVRGAMWALPVLPLAYWHPKVLALLGMAVAMPLAALVDHFLRRGNWGVGEFTRGAVMGLICAFA